MSIETKFTPGNWFAVEYAGYWNIQTTPFYQEKVDIMDAENVGIEQAKANAKLASAAPDMYNALIQAKDSLHRFIKRAYDEAGADEETADKLATQELEKMLLFNAMKKATE